MRYLFDSVSDSIFVAGETKVLEACFLRVVLFAPAAAAASKVDTSASAFVLVFSANEG
jgi:hypothetical protein